MHQFREHGKLGEPRLVLSLFYTLSEYLNDLSRTGTLSTSSSGSMASFLSARKLNEVEMATAETPTVWVQSQVKKYSRRDALLAAVMVNGFDGNILGTNQLFFTNVFRDMAFHRRWAIANL
ncbi:unnamed protein product [Caenorhabditis auriculariae]|uniref:Uncharacterized protein n=1 Tax=Caenorhabditis auriculariae TaxID=2777116 RepID=A0A8S1HNL6_9PELO|nr:unnamed protein product [Caenorhabditis auriculariae]